MSSPTIKPGKYYFYVVVWGGGPLYVTARQKDGGEKEDNLEVFMQNAAIPEAVWVVKEEGSSGTDPKTYSISTLDGVYICSVGPNQQLIASLKQDQITDNEKWVIQEGSVGENSGHIRRANVLGGHPLYWYIINAVGTPVFLNDTNPTLLQWREAPPRD